MLINSNLAIDPKGDWKRGFKVLKKFYCLPCKNFSHPKFETKTSHTFAKIIKNRINTLQWQNLNPHHVASSQDIDLPCHCEEVSENIFEQAWQYSSLEIIRLISCGLTCKWPYNPHTCIQNQLPFPCKTPLNISDVNWYKKPYRLKPTENCRLFCQYFTFTSPCALKKIVLNFFSLFIYFCLKTYHCIFIEGIFDIFWYVASISLGQNPWNWCSQFGLQQKMFPQLYVYP